MATTSLLAVILYSNSPGAENARLFGGVCGGARQRRGDSALAPSLGPLVAKTAGIFFLPPSSPARSYPPAWSRTGGAGRLVRTAALAAATADVRGRGDDVDGRVCSRLVLTTAVAAVSGAAADGVISSSLPRRRCRPFGSSGGDGGGAVDATTATVTFARSRPSRQRRRRGRALPATGDGAIAFVMLST